VGAGIAVGTGLAGDSFSYLDAQAIAGKAGSHNRIPLQSTNQTLESQNEHRL